MTNQTDSNRIFKLYELNQGNFVFAELPDESETDSLIKSNSLIEIDSFEVTQKKVFLTSDSVVYIMDESGFIKFNTLSEYQAAKAAGYFQKTTYTSIMANISFDNIEFVKDRSKWIDELLEKLQLPKSMSLDKELLVLVEQKIKKQENAHIFYRKYFINIIAFMGELFIKKIGNFEWELQERKEKNIIYFDPFLKYEDERIPIFFDLYNSIFLERNFENPLLNVYDYYFEGH